MDEGDYTTILHYARQNLNQLAMIDRVEKLFQVQINTVFITFTDIRLGAPQGLVSTAFRTEAKTVVTELAFVKRTKHLADGLLDKAVNNKWGYLIDVSYLHPWGFQPGERDWDGRYRKAKSLSVHPYGVSGKEVDPPFPSYRHLHYRHWT